MTEDDLFQRYRLEVPGFHSRIENARCTGMPDVFSVLYQQICMIELKEETKKSRTIRIRATQVNWIHAYNTYGRSLHKPPVWLLTTENRLYSASDLVYAMQHRGLDNFYTNKPGVYKVCTKLLGIPCWEDWREIREVLGAIPERNEQ